MVRKPRKSPVQHVIKNLLESEIPEIQNTAKQLAEWTKQLEEHSWKLQHYATEIESLAEEEAEASSELNITELLRNLEVTLDGLRKEPDGDVAGDVAEVEIESLAEEESEEEEGVEVEIKEVKEAPSPETGTSVYTTPDGFVVRKSRNR